ncbi:DUF2975 domain-containing protein [Niabella sp. CC-SYL272]|uniref:DUF2975 domain-containing protein n=1 Tax=Niabella agricola TaxID=2891571 RepID=UPI001F2C23FF|nr:DUF2975 domain-containing protein [Niabella agricola]MCF3110748.1 DUF2975 domain-containing protein [Niabella agricola]
MKIADSRIIKILDRISGAVFLFTLLVLLVKIFSSGAPALSGSVRGYQINNITAKPQKRPDTTYHDPGKTLDQWFKKTIIVQPHNEALVHLRFKTYKDLLNPVTVLFQLAYYSYYIIIVLAAFQLKMFFGNLSRNEVFTKKNTRKLFITGLLFMLIPLIKSIQNVLFIEAINGLNINDSGYSFSYSFRLVSPETIFGAMMIVFSLVFKAGTDVQQENEAFI